MALVLRAVLGLLFSVASNCRRLLLGSCFLFRLLVEETGAELGCCSRQRGGGVYWDAVAGDHSLWAILSVGSLMGITAAAHRQC